MHKSSSCKSANGQRHCSDIKLLFLSAIAAVGIGSAKQVRVIEASSNRHNA